MYLKVARKSDRRREKRALALNSGGDLSHYHRRRRGSIWLCLQVSSHGDEGEREGGRGEELFVVRVWAPPPTAETEKLHAIIEMCRSYDEVYCDCLVSFFSAWKLTTQRLNGSSCLCLAAKYVLAFSFRASWHSFVRGCTGCGIGFCRMFSWRVTDHRPLFDWTAQQHHTIC